jgi:hypothetical protein
MGIGILELTKATLNNFRHIFYELTDLSIACLSAVE